MTAIARAKAGRDLVGRAAGIGILAAMVTGCGAPQQVTVDHAWVRLSAVKQNPAAAYFTLHGGPTDAALVDVTSDVAVKAEMHATMSAGRSMTRMAPLRSVALPAGGTVAFKPGGRHVMLFDMNPGIKPGATMTLTFTFADSTRIRAPAEVIGAGDAAPE